MIECRTRSLWRFLEGGLRVSFGLGGWVHRVSPGFRVFGFSLSKALPFSLFRIVSMSGGSML